MGVAPKLSPARIAYAGDGTPRSEAFDDVYHSTEGGLEQAHHVFIAGNALPFRWQGRECFTILETGFGLGLNFLATWQAWRNDPQRCARLHFISSELHPFSGQDLQTLHAQWPALGPLATELHMAWPALTPGFHHLLLDHGRVVLTLLFGDARQTLPELRGKADAIYLDGFAPQKNPELWSAGLLDLLSKHAAPGATLASWCVAGAVRTALVGAGWRLSKQPGFGRKRHMLCGQFGTHTVPVMSTAAPRKALVIGAGIAGCAAAEALARRGWQVSLIERKPEPAGEASGNPVGLLHPMLARDDNPAARYSRAAYLYSLRLLRRLSEEGLLREWGNDGILEIASDADDAKEKQLTLQRNDFPEDYVSWLDRSAASACAGLEVGNGGWWFPQGAWVSPPALCRALLARCGNLLETHFCAEVDGIAYEDGQWHAHGKSGRIASASALILANAESACRLLPATDLSLRRIRGQITYLSAHTLNGLRVALCGAGYLTPPMDGIACVGASFVEDDDAEALRQEEHDQNLQRLARLLPSLAAPSPVGGRVAFRTASHDRLPLAGQLPGAGMRPTHTLASLPRQKGLYALLGLGSRGLIWGPLGAELVAAQLCGEVWPIEASLGKAIDPARYELKKIRRQR